MPAATKSDAALRLGPADRVAVVAGSGRLPIDVAQGLAALGHKPLVIRVRGEADDDPAYAAFDAEEMSLGAFASHFASVKRRGFTHMVLAGGIGRRPKLSEIRVNLMLLRFLPRLLKALIGGDDRLLSLLVKSIEAEGVRVVGAHQIVPDLLADEGPMSRVRPSTADRRDLDAALIAARAIGGLDIGQGAVAIGGRAIALEGIEGTDAMLERVKGLRGHGRLAGRTRGVLVKCAKPAQELRADLPTIGPATVEGAHAAGLAGIGVEAGRTLVMERGKTVALADRLGLFVVGLPKDRTP
jgi:DUF1009 family protein